MKTLRRKLSALLAVVLILGVFAVPSVSAATVSGATTKAKAITLKTDGTYYDYHIKSTQKLTYFKFKTNSYKAWYRGYFAIDEDDVYDGNMEVFFRRADDTVIQKGSWGVEFFNNLQPNSWYYLIVKNTKKSVATIEIHIESWKDEDRNTKASAQKITLAKTYDSTLVVPYDDDYYKFTCTATGKYTVIVRAVDDVNIPVDASFIRADGSVAQKTRLKKAGAAMIRNCTLTKGKTYYIRVKNYRTSSHEWEQGDTWAYKVRIQKKK